MTPRESSTASDSGGAFAPAAVPGRQASSGAAPRAGLTASADGGDTRIALSGELTAHTLSGVQTSLRDELRKARGGVLFDLSGLDGLDTAGALLITLSLRQLRDAGRKGDVIDPSATQARLLKQSVLPATDNEKGAERLTTPLRQIEALGRLVCEWLRSHG